MSRRALWLTVSLAGVFVIQEPAVVHGADPGCLGDCGNRKHDAEGWCGHCPSHCKGDTEAECTNNCNNAHNWERECEEAKKRHKKGHPAIGHFCSESGHGRQAIQAARQGCLNSCGGQQECRRQWCEGDAPQRKACYEDVQNALTACETTCNGGKPLCSEERCLGPLMVANCNGKREITGFCISFTKNF